MTTDALLLEATPALIDGWCGPGAVLYAGGHQVDGCVMLNGDIVLHRVDFDEEEAYVFLDAEALVPEGTAIYLDLSREECRDRVGRCYRRRYARAVCTAPGPMQLYRGSDGNGRIVNWFGQHHSNHVPDLADLDPSDDTRLPDGSFRVHALGLLYVARKLLAS